MQMPVDTCKELGDERTKTESDVWISSVREFRLVRQTRFDRRVLPATMKRRLDHATFDEADQSRFLGTCLPSPGLGFGFGRGWVRVRVSSEEGVGGYVPRNLDWSDWANRLNSNDNYNNDLYSAVYNSLINGALKESKVDCCREKAWCMTRPVSGTACPTRTGGPRHRSGHAPSLLSATDSIVAQNGDFKVWEFDSSFKKLIAWNQNIIRSTPKYAIPQGHSSSLIFLYVFRELVSYITLHSSQSSCEYQK